MERRQVKTPEPQATQLPPELDNPEFCKAADNLLGVLKNFYTRHDGVIPARDELIKVARALLEKRV